MINATYLISKALRSLGLISSGDSPTGAELQDGLLSLNSVIDSWSSDPLFYFCENDESFTLSSKANYCIGDSSLTIDSITRTTTTATVTTEVAHSLETGNKVTISGATETDYNLTAQVVVTGANTFTYTVANSPSTPATGSPVLTAGDFRTLRPLRIMGAFTRDGSTDTPLGLITEQYWTNVQDKVATGATQTKLLYRPNYPFGQIYVYPIPTGTPVLRIKSEKMISQFSDLTTDKLLPPGYQHMLELALAIEVAGEYQAKVPQETLMQMKESYQSILNNNRRMLKSSKFSGNQSQQQTPMSN